MHGSGRGGGGSDGRRGGLVPTPRSPQPLAPSVLAPQPLKNVAHDRRAPPDEESIGEVTARDAVSPFVAAESSGAQFAELPLPSGIHVRTEEHGMAADPVDWGAYALPEDPQDAAEVAGPIKLSAEDLREISWSSGAIAPPLVVRADDRVASRAPPSREDMRDVLPPAPRPTAPPDRSAAASALMTRAGTEAPLPQLPGLVAQRSTPSGAASGLPRGLPAAGAGAVSMPSPTPLPRLTPASGGSMPTPLPRLVPAGGGAGLTPLPRLMPASGGSGMTPLPRAAPPPTAPGMMPLPRSAPPPASTSPGMMPLPRASHPPPSTSAAPRVSHPPGAGGSARATLPPPRASTSGLAPTPRGPLPSAPPTADEVVRSSAPPPRPSQHVLPAPLLPAPLRPATALGAEPSKDPLAPQVGQWLAELSRAVRGSRLYADNNAMYVGFVNAAFSQLDDLLLHRPELVVTIAEDRLGFGGDVVHTNADRIDGLPATLFQSSLRSLTFKREITRDELAQLIRTVGADYSSAHRSGEDMITNLWRVALPHVAHTSARLVTKVKTGARTRPRRAEHVAPTVEAIVAALSAEPPRREDVRGFLAGTTDEILAFERLHGATGDELDLLRLVSLFNQASTHRIEREDFVLELELHDQPVELTIRLFERVLGAVLEEGGFTEESATAAILVRLYDALLDAGHFVNLTQLVGRIAEFDEPEARARAPERALIARQILPHVAAPDRVRRVLAAYSDAMSADGDGDERAEAALSLLEAMGERGAAPALDHIDVVAKSAWRRTVLALVARLVPLNAQALHKRMAAAKHWSVVCDLLSMASVLPPEHALALVVRSGRHPEPKVRAEALRMLGKHEDLQIDTLVAQRLRDPDREVRMEALSLAGVRKGDEIVAALAGVMEEDELLSRDGEELRRWCTVYTQLVTFRAVPALARLLQPSLLGRILPSVDAHLAAIEALGTIDHPAARTVLGKALRSINKSVRTAAKRALDHSELLGFSETPPQELALVPRALPAGAPTAQVSPEAFGHEVRGVLSSLFEDEDGPQPAPLPAAAALPPGPLPADERWVEAEIVRAPAQPRAPRLIPERTGGDE